MHGSKSKEVTEIETGGVRKFLTIVVIAAVVIWIGTGCHIARIKSFGLDMGGLEIEYWEPAPVIGESGHFDSDSTIPYVVPVSYQKLLPYAKRQ